MKKAEKNSAFFIIGNKLLLCGSAYRASVSASAAADALVSVDNVLAVTLGNTSNRARICASTAADTFIGNFVCHLEKPPF